MSGRGLRVERSRVQTLRVQFLWIPSVTFSECHDLEKRKGERDSSRRGKPYSFPLLACAIIVREFD